MEKAIKQANPNFFFYYSVRLLFAVCAGAIIFIATLPLKVVTDISNGTTVMIFFCLWGLSIAVAFLPEVGFFKKLVAWAMGAGVYGVSLISAMIFAAIYTGSWQENGPISVKWYLSESWAGYFHILAIFLAWKAVSALLRQFRVSDPTQIVQPPHITILERWGSNQMLVGDSRLRWLWCALIANLLISANLFSEIKMIKEKVYGIPDSENEYLQILEDQQKSHE